MGAGARTVGWELLGEEPVPGDPAAIHAAADGYRRAAGAAAHAGTGGARLAAGAPGWTGGAASAFTDAAGQLPSRAQVLVDAAERGGTALGEFAQVMRTMQSTADDLLAAAIAADQARLEAEEEGERLRAEHAAASVAELAARHAWRVAQQRADGAEALGDPSAIVLQQEASRLRIAVNDAASQLMGLQADIAAAGSAAIDAQARLDAARADAQRLAVEFEGAAASAAATLVPVPPAGGSLFAGLGGLPGLAPSASAPGPVPTAAGAAASAIPVHAPAGPAPASPVGGGPAGHAHDHHHATATVSAADLVRVASALETVRRGGAPIGIGTLAPTLEVFRQFDRLGLQPVAARGAAIARAFGFEGTIGGLGWRPTPSDHTRGLAIDLMTYDDLATGQALADFFLAHREELGVTYVIFNRRIASHVGDWVWRPYRHPAGRTDPTAMHVDHPHISFDPDDNAYALAAFGLEA